MEITPNPPLLAELARIETEEQEEETQTAARSAAADFDSFLNLLTAQLRNQDPLQPIDSTQFVAQLASFSTVEQLIGTNERLDALAAYSNSHKFTLSPYAHSGLSERAERGKTLFASAETKCATCHSGPFYSDSRPTVAAEITRHDVGTGEQDDTEKMGPAYDTPTLLGLYRTAPYLHHGKALELRDVLTTFNRNDRHGKTSHLTEQQIDDVIEFLKALPFQDPEIEAAQLGLRKVR